MSEKSVRACMYLHMAIISSYIRVLPVLTAITT